MPALGYEWVQGKLAAFHPNIFVRLKICDQLAQVHPHNMLYEGLRTIVS